MKTKRRYSVLRASPVFGTSEPFRGPLTRSRTFDAPRVEDPPQLDVMELDAQQVRAMSADPGVAAIAPAMRIRLVKPVAVEPAVSGSSWGIQAIGADLSQFDGSGVSVAVLDTGIDESHAAFAGVTLVKRDFTGTGEHDVEGHGTHCAGTIFGRDVAGTRMGVARGVTRAVIGKVLGDQGGSSDALFQGIQWALDQGANVISMSLGFDFPGMVQELIGRDWPADLATSAALEAYRGNLRMLDAIMEMARARQPLDGGCVIVAAAGNESHREIHPSYEIAAGLPAAADGVIAVGAVERAGSSYRVTDFSNTLPQLSAPGASIVSAKIGGGLVAMSGTSMATPHVAGVAALWWHALRAQGNVVVNASAVVSRLLTSARPNVFASGVEVADRGMGLVACP